MEGHELAFWIGFNIFIVLMLALDLGVFNRKAHAIRFREAAMSSLIWIALAVAFAIGVRFWLGKDVALEFTTGYVIELSLSVDNLFVFLLIFRYFRVEGEFQHKVLFWGIIGALICRTIFILTGVALIQRFHWIIYVFGAFLVYTGVKLALGSDEETHPEKNPVLRWARKTLPLAPDQADGRFFVRNGRLAFTPLFLVLLVVETTDIIFAADSIPAVLAITRDPFIVYTSNVFAIMGLRSMYFALAGLMDLFHYLQYGLSVVLVFVGLKMLVSAHMEIPTTLALGIVGGVLLISVIASVLRPKRETA